MTDEEVIEKLNGKVKMYREMADSFCNSNVKLKAEIEKLKAEIEELKTENKRLIELMPKICETCKYEYELGYEEPCVSCKNRKNWKLKGVV